MDLSVLPAELQEEAEATLVTVCTAQEDDAETEDPFRTLTIAQRSPLQTRHIEYSPMLPSYPQTDLLGFTYVIEVQAADRQGEFWKHLVEHQYCTRRASPPKPARSPVFGGQYNEGIKGMMYRYSCTGVKYCQYVPMHMRHVSHTHVTLEELERTRRLEEQYPSATDPNPKRRNAIKAYWMIQDRFLKNRACRQTQGSCQPVFARFRNASDTHNTRNYFVKCSNYQSGNQDHFFHQWRYHEPIDWEYLGSYYNGTFNSEQSCFRVEATTSRLENCGIPHPQGPGLLENHGCDVRFHFFVPDNLQSVPFLFFSSHGIHTHQAPPPVKTPERYIQDLRQLITLANATELTFVRFQTSPALQEYLRSHGANSLGQLHVSLNNTGRLSHEIQRHRMLTYPEGTQLAGTLFEFQRQQGLHENERYIQQIFNDESGLMIICFYKRAAEVLLNEPDMEVDMSFKRIRQADMNEISFARFLETHNKSGYVSNTHVIRSEYVLVFTFARIIVSTDTTATYKLAFQRFFNLVSERTGLPVQWYYLHGRGFRAIIVDMLLKQAAGIGQYLATLDPAHDWRWHLRHVIVYCTVHFERTVFKVTGTGPEEEALRVKMKSLRVAPNAEAYYAVISQLKLHPNPKVRAWAAHKEAEIVRSGLQHYFSLMDSEHFVFIRTHTNAVEQAANKGYATGIRMNLLPAIQKAAIRDLADVDAWRARETQSINHLWRSNSPIQRGSTQLRRSQSSQSLALVPLQGTEATPYEVDSSAPIAPSSPMLPPSTTAITRPRKRTATVSSSSQSDMYRKRGAHNLSSLREREALLAIEAKEIANQRERLINEEKALELEERQRQYRLRVQEEGG